VIGTASAKNDRFLRELGADEVIDYTETRFEDLIHDVDLVLDTIGGGTLDRSWGVLRKGGTLVTIAGADNPKKAKRFGVRSLFFIVEPNRQQLMEIGRLIDAGALRVVVEAVFPLEQARMAFEKSLQGHNRGKIVLRVPENG
jgi:NADPH:quinone reductase-like Zn-dependent oxidoreductase